MQVRWEAIRKELKSAASSKGIVLLATKIISITSQMGLWNQQMSYSQLSDKAGPACNEKANQRNYEDGKNGHDITSMTSPYDSYVWTCVDLDPPWRTLNIAKCDHQDSTIMTFDKADQVAKSAPLTIMSSEPGQGRPRGFIIYDANIQDKYCQWPFQEPKLEVPTICPYMVQ